jgi:hypothetical protein
VAKLGTKKSQSRRERAKRALRSRCGVDRSRSEPDAGRHGRKKCGRGCRRRGFVASQGVEAVPAPAPAPPSPHQGLDLFLSLFPSNLPDWFWWKSLHLGFAGKQMITAGCLAGVSDSVAQKLSGYQKIERRRLLLKMVRTPMLFFFWGLELNSGALIFGC